MFSVSGNTETCGTDIPILEKEKKKKNFPWKTAALMWWGLCSIDSHNAIQFSLSVRTIPYLIQCVMPCVINLTWATDE